MTLEDNLFGGNEEMSELLNKCLNEDGDLYSKMKISKTKLNLIGEFLSISRAINKQENQLLSYISLERVLLKGKHNFEIIYNSPVKSTNENVNNNDDYQKNLNTLNQCNDDYYFVFKNCENSPTVNGKECIIISDSNNNPSVIFDDENCDIIYTQIANSYGELMSKLKLINKIYNEENNIFELSENILNELSSISHISNIDLTSNLVKIYDSLISENESFQNLFNCSHMKQDLIEFFEVFKNKFAKDLYQIFCCFISSSILIPFSIIYALIDLYDGIENDKPYSKTVYECSSNLKFQTKNFNTLPRETSSINGQYFTYVSHRNLNNEN